MLSEGKPDDIERATDIACGVGNTYGGHVYEGTDRDMIELCLRRMVSAGYSFARPSPKEGTDSE
jgi:hypothetical protein